MGSDEQKDKLHELFLACDVDRSGRIEKWEFVKICTELRVRSTEVDALFSELDSDNDGTINVDEFMKGFQESHLLNEDTMSENTDESCSGAWEDFKSRLEDQVKFIPR